MREENLTQQVQPCLREEVVRLNTNAPEAMRAYEERIPTPSLNEKYEIYVKECLVGYTLSIGCQTIATKNPHEVSAILNYYLSHKVECQRAYHEGKLDELVKKAFEE